MSSNRSNLRQIAEEADVSISTVSRVLSGHNHVSERTRERVQAVANRLKYRPNLLVRGIQTGKTKTVGVMMSPSDPFHAEILRGVHDTLIEVDYVPLLVWPDRRNEGTGPSELEQIHRLVDHCVDGVILSPMEDSASDDYLHEIWERQIPLVVVDRELPYSRADFVGCDDEAIGRLAAMHLLRAGHRRLGHIAGPAYTSTGRQRQLGFEAQVATSTQASVVTLEEESFWDGLAQARAMLSKADPPTGIFAANDHLALGVYDAAAEMGLRIGLDLAVIGCGNLEFGDYLRPRLTTVDQQAYQTGCEAAKLILARCAGEAPADRSVSKRLQPQLISRESSKDGNAPLDQPENA